MEIRGEFHQGMFQSLGREDLELLEQYLLADFSIKALAERSGMGYTALRSRLDRLIQRYKDLKTNEQEKKRILDLLAEGKIDAAEAAQFIAAIGSQ